ncbi:proline-rich transmembrane protein 1-like [Saccoglossus kowalevskii]|uniref:Proline-rich transmembrane protein 1-like n=1 Tax=Saccoglossus kowalevskii TaxID=10224 RepID=A0ABM0LTS8_SACKO|nr:PREDICTED: proline-rich transmembrane protein 1-like [Saccoglossus kowalevskii]
MTEKQDTDIKSAEVPLSNHSTQTDAKMAGFPPAYTCTNLVAPAPVERKGHSTAPPNYLPLAIFATVCCFMPTGIFAILRASDANTAFARNDMTTAWKQAKRAKTLSYISIGIGCCSFLLVLILCAGILSLIPYLFSEYQSIINTEYQSIFNTTTSVY